MPAALAPTPSLPFDAVHLSVAPWAVHDGRTLTLQLALRDRRGAAEPPQVAVRVLLDNEEYLFDLQPAPHLATADTLADATPQTTAWTARVPACRTGPATRYCFRVRAPGSTLWLAATGLQEAVPAQHVHFRLLPPGGVPAWLREQVVYQVFPDRFHRTAPVGPARDDPRRLRNWGEPLPQDGSAHQVFYGGNLDGVRERLDHIASLGATTLYLNPVFCSPSNHRYDTSDYFRVDPLLGGNEALVRLAQALRSRGMKLVLDAVLNHTGASHPWVSADAQASPAAPVRYARDNDGRPVYWKGHDTLPKLDHAHPATRHTMIDGPDSVLRHWLRPPVQADGWRLDAVHMLGDGAGAGRNADHLRAMRAAVKSERPDAALVGEHFAEGTDWLQGDQEDASMNYWGFTLPLWRWLAAADLKGEAAPLSTPALVDWLALGLALVPGEIALSQWNALDSHDTPRLFTLLGERVDAQKLAMALQFTFPGTPCLYYGDEIGLPGHNDPDNRRCFDWDPARWQPALLAHQRACAALRQSRTELRHGGWLPLGHGEHWWAYARVVAGQATVVVLNRGGEVELTLPLDAPVLPRGHWAAWPQGFGMRTQQLHAEASPPRLNLHFDTAGVAVWCSQGDTPGT